MFGVMSLMATCRARLPACGRSCRGCGEEPGSAPQPLQLRPHAGSLARQVAMSDMTPNIPEIVAEVRDRFERYEKALIDKDVDVLDGTFWNSPHTIRYAMTEHGYGFEEIHAHRVARPPGPSIKEKRIR